MQIDTSPCRFASLLVILLASVGATVAIAPQLSETAAAVMGTAAGSGVIIANARFGLMRFKV